MSKPVVKPPESSQVAIIRDGAVLDLDRILGQLGAKRILLVVDQPAYILSGAEKAVSPCLRNREVTFFHEFELNPKVEDVARGVNLVRTVNPDAIVALGGGSAIDMGKIIGACGVHDRPAVDYVTGKASLSHDGPPLIAIPTTAGTGSEATHFAVAYVEGKKYSLAHRSLLPDLAIVDPELTFSLPPAVTAASGLDALCQTIESIGAVNATDTSMAYASQGLDLVIRNLKCAVRDSDRSARRAMAHAAHLSGKAINISKTTAPHALSYAITTRFGVPHGKAVALTLGAFLVYNSQVDKETCTDPRGPEAVRARIDQVVRLLDAATAKQACDRLKTLMKAIDSPLRLRDVNISAEDIPTLVAEVNVERMSNNPRAIDSDSLKRLLLSVL